MLSILFLVFVSGALAQNSGNSIVDVLAAHRETTLLGLLNDAGLTDTLKTGGPFTVFAPTNSAFIRLGSSTLNSLRNNPQALAEILKYHVVNGSVMPSDLLVNEKQLMTLEGSNLRVNHYFYNNHTTVEGSGVLTAYKADNGMVYLVDHVLKAPNGTLYDIISNDPDLSTLKKAIDAAGLASTLADGPYTVFAPTNYAFQKLGDDLVQKLLANPDLLGTILSYHVLHGTLYSKGMHSGSLHTLDEADRLRLYSSFSGYTVTADHHTVTMKDVSATNGVLHKLGSVLLPSSVISQIKAL